MTIGERIKKIRVFRKMTMDELGGALGFEGKNMSVRISQYETGARIPGEDMILKLYPHLPGQRQIHPGPA